MGSNKMADFGAKSEHVHGVIKNMYPTMLAEGK